MIQLINSVPLVDFCVSFGNKRNLTLFLIIFRNWKTFTGNFALNTEQPLTMSGSAEAV